MSVATVCRARRHMIRVPETPETIECVSGGKAESSPKGGGGGSHVTGGDRAQPRSGCYGATSSQLFSDYIWYNYAFWADYSDLLLAS